MISKDSVLFKIPQELNPRQASLIEGIRFLAISVFISYDALCSALLSISNEGPKEYDLISFVLKEAWSIIDSTFRLGNLITTFFPNNKDLSDWDELIYILNKTRQFRNAFQHL